VAIYWAKEPHVHAAIIAACIALEVVFAQ